MLVPRSALSEFALPDASTSVAHINYVAAGGAGAADGGKRTAASVSGPRVDREMARLS